MTITTGYGVNSRRFTVKGNALVDTENKYKGYEFPSEAALHRWIGARIANGKATIET